MSSNLQRITVIILVLLATLLVTQAAFSLSWPIAHDEAPLFYEAFLVQNGRMPYRDFFDFQMPGSYAAYSLLGLLSNFGAVRIRILDLIILTAILGVTYLGMRRFGKASAFAGAILFGLHYLGGGPSLALQREYLILLFIALSIWIGVTDSLNFRKRLLLGLLYGAAATIKPHAALGLVPFLLFDMADLRQRRELSLPALAKQILFPVAIGFAIPVSLVALWLALTHSLTPFGTILLSYIPLYAQINGQLTVTPSAERTAYLLSQAWYFGGSGLWLIPAGLGIYINRDRQSYLLASLALFYALYPALTGQFFPYHYIPFIYTIILVAALSLSTFHSPLSKRPSFPFHLSSFILLTTVLVTVKPSQTFLRQIEGKEIATSTDRAAQLSAFLEKHLEPGDEVQPLDWTGGTLLAMLEARAPIATSYVFDFYFYHHISEPYIQSLRSDFMDELQTAVPRFIIEVTAVDKPWISGEDTSRDFPELRVFLNEKYSVTMEREDFIIYERR